MAKDIYEITDDSGFLAIIDPVAYSSFVDSEWTFNQLVRHFQDETALQRMAIWGTGREDIWRVEIRHGRTSEPGFREFTTLLRSSNDHLLLTNYESLTMAAQFEDVRLPEPHQKSMVFPLASGLYSCRVVQRFDPDICDPSNRKEEVDFRIEIVAAENHVASNSEMLEIPWMKV